MISPSVVDEIRQAFGIAIAKTRVLGGGTIAQTLLLQAAEATYFAKIISAPRGFSMLEREWDGLEAIRKTNTLAVPLVHGCSQLTDHAILLLEYLPAEKPRSADYVSLGRLLAKMHLTSSPYYGWEKDNYIGLLPQSNEPAKDWGRFFVSQRLLPQYEMAIDRGFLKPSEIPSEGVLLSRIRNLLPSLQPALLHGDLWSGNHMYSRNTFYLIDPSVHYGHSEVDLAMTRLFGGFPPSFYRAYHEVSPAEAGWENRTALYQLYYLLVHLNIFGGSYYGSVKETNRKLFGP